MWWINQSLLSGWLWLFRLLSFAEGQGSTRIPEMLWLSTLLHPPRSYFSVPLDARVFGPCPIFWKWNWEEIPGGVWARLASEDRAWQSFSLLGEDGDSPSPQLRAGMALSLLPASLSRTASHGSPTLRTRSCQPGSDSPGQPDCAKWSPWRNTFPATSG